MTKAYEQHYALMNERYGFVPGTKIIFDPDVYPACIFMLGDTWKRFVAQHRNTEVDFINYAPSGNYKTLGANGLRVRFPGDLWYCMSADHFRQP